MQTYEVQFHEVPRVCTQTRASRMFASMRASLSHGFQHKPVALFEFTGAQ